MIVHRRDFLDAMARQKPDRMGLVHPGEDDATAIVTYARHLVAVQVQAERLFQEMGHDVSTPARAALALALHAADPAVLDFPPCICGPYPLRLCLHDDAPACRRRHFIQTCQRRARRPLAINKSLFHRIKDWLSA